MRGNAWWRQRSANAIVAHPLAFSLEIAWQPQVYGKPAPRDLIVPIRRWQTLPYLVGSPDIWE